MEEKRSIRKLIREKVLSMSAEERSSASAEIARQVFQTESWQRAKVVMAYMSMPTEPDTGEILREAQRQGKTVLLPLCGKAPEMEALPWRGEEWMMPGPYGILEPTPEEASASPPEPDLILVPCVAATKSGLRLGHGAGYYDWFLQRHPAETICLCFHQQLVETLPSDPWDIPMSKIIWA